MQDGKSSSYGAPNVDVLGKCRYRLDKRVSRNRSAGNRKSGSATSKSMKCSTAATNRRVKSGSSITRDGEKINNELVTKLDATMKDEVKEDYAVTGSKMFIDTGTNMCPIPDKIWRVPYRAGQRPKEKVVFNREEAEKDKDIRDHIRHYRLNKTKKMRDNTLGTLKRQPKEILHPVPNSTNQTRAKSPLQMNRQEVASPIQMITHEERISKPQLSTTLLTPSKQRRDEPHFMSSPELPTPSLARSAPSNKDGVISPISFNTESGFVDRASSIRSQTTLSQYSTRSSLSVTINTNTPISAWSDYTVPNNEEMRERLLKGRFGVHFENYNPLVSRKKLLYVPTPTEDEDYDTDLEDGGLDLVAVERARQRRQDSPFPDYKNLCRKLDSVPNSYFLRHALEDDLDLRFRYPGVTDTKALATEIKNDATISKLDLTDNGLGPAQLSSLAEMLHDNTTITDIRNVFLKELNLSHNGIGELGMKYLCPFLAGNVTLDVLDISWNHIRKQGAVMLAKAVKVNQQLRVLRVSMNGFNVDGARALGSALEENTTLWELDVSANRIPRPGARALAAGLASNTELRCLKVGFNPLTPEGAEAILDAVDGRDNSEGMVIDFEGVYVNQDFESQAVDLMEDSRVKIIFLLDPSRRGRSRDLLSSYVHSLQLLLSDLNIDVSSIYADVTEDNVIISGNDVMQRLLKSNRLRDKIAQAELNHFIYSNGSRKFLIKDWIMALQKEPTDAGGKSSRMMSSLSSGSQESRRSPSSHWWKEKGSFVDRSNASQGSQSTSSLT